MKPSAASGSIAAAELAAIQGNRKEVIKLVLKWSYIAIFLGMFNHQRSIIATQ